MSVFLARFKSGLTSVLVGGDEPDDVLALIRSNGLPKPSELIELPPGSFVAEVVDAEGDDPVTLEPFDELDAWLAENDADDDDEEQEDNDTDEFRPSETGHAAWIREEEEDAEKEKPTQEPES